MRFPLSLTFLVLALQAVLGAAYSLAEPQESVSQEPLVLRAYSLPRGFFSEPDPASKTGERKPAPGGPASGDRRAAVKVWLKELGISFPPGSDAFYQDEPGYPPCVIVRQTPKNLEVLDAMILPTCIGFPRQLQIAISAYLLSPKEAQAIAEQGNLESEALQHLEKTGALLDRMVCLTGLSQTSKMSHRKGRDSYEAQVIPVLGADDQTIDVQLDYRLQSERLDPKKPIKITVETNARVEDGHTVMVKLLTLPSPESRTIVIMLQGSILNASGWTLREMDRAKP